MNERKSQFEIELETLLGFHLSKHRQESNTPDYILAEYLTTCLKAYEYAVSRRDANLKSFRR